MNTALHTFAGLVLAGLFAAAVFAPAAAKTAVTKTDSVAGKEIYTRCLACHALDYDRTGPRHYGIFGRRAGSVEGFPYSSAMKRSKIVWSEQTLDRFLANPAKMVPGTTMGYAGVTDKQERSNLIAYLKHENDAGECKK